MIDVFVLAHNGAERTATCLAAVDASASARILLHLIDNGSRPSLAPLIAPIRRPIVYQRSEVNLPYAQAFNQGIGTSNDDAGAYLVELNNDCYVTPDCLETMARVLDLHPEVGIVGPRLVYPHGEIQNAGITWKGNNLEQRFGHTNGSDPRVSRSGAMDAICAACRMVRRALWNALGGLCLDYVPGGHEDMDFCWRAREHGWCVWYEGSAVAIHEESVTFKSTPEIHERYVAGSTHSLALLRQRWQGKSATLPYPTDPALI